jgi:hypothetical protein
MRIMFKADDEADFPRKLVSRTNTKDEVLMDDILNAISPLVASLASRRSTETLM